MSSASLVSQTVGNPPAVRETWVQSLGWEDPLEKGKATHSSILAWIIAWTVESMGLQRGLCRRGARGREVSCKVPSGQPRLWSGSQNLTDLAESLPSQEFEWPLLENLQ